MSASVFDCPGFAQESRTVARVLGSVLEGAPGLQERLLKALAPTDKRRKLERSAETAALIVEVLLMRCQQGYETVFINDITGMVNQQNGGLGLSSKNVGGIVRNELGLYATRNGYGYRLQLDPSVRQCIQRLAEAYYLL